MTRPLTNAAMARLMKNALIGAALIRFVLTEGWETTREKNLRLFEIARVLVRLNHVARFTDRDAAFFMDALRKRSVMHRLWFARDL
jgi:hypothetical protein